MRKLLFFVMLLIPTALAAQTTAAFNGVCMQGAVSSLTSGLPSTNKLQGLIPQCNVAVYNTGMLTLATIYSDASNTVRDNPFTADVAARWLFFAAENQGYDVVMSGGQGNPYCTTAPLCYTSPVTLTDLLVGGSGGSTFQAYVNGTPLVTPGSANFINSSSITVTNPSTNQIQFTAVNPPVPLIIQHNDSTTGVNQGTLDFNDTTPTPPSGNESVTFQTDSGTGRLSGYVPIPSLLGGLQMTVPNPSTTTAWIDIYPSTVTITPGSAPNSAGANLSSAYFDNPACGTSGPYPACGTYYSVKWTFAIPSYINPANVTQVNGSAISAAWAAQPNGFVTTATLTCQVGIVTPVGIVLASSDPTPGRQFPLTYFTDNLTATGAEIPTVTCTATVTSEEAFESGLLFSLPAVLLQVKDTVDTAPTDTQIQVNPPLTYDVRGLGFDATYPVAGKYLQGYTVAQATALLPTTDDAYQIIDSTVTTGCAVGGGSNPVPTYWTGPGGCFEIQGGSGGGSVPGGALGSLPYQSAASTTTFISSPTTSGHAFVPMWNPSGSAIAPTAADLGTYLGTNIVASSPIVATPTTLGVSLSCPTCGVSGSGTNFTVLGGSTLGSANFNATSPTADASYLALLPKISGGDFIVEAPYATGAAFGVMEGDASTITMTAGVASCTTATTSQLGCVKPDGTVITDTAGAITVPKASSSVFGVVKVDGTTITASSGVISATQAISGGTSGEVAIFGSASTITSAIALGTTGSDIPQLSSGLLNNSVVNWAAPSAIGTGTPAAGTFSALTLSSITGSAQCLHVNSSGVVSGTGADCGSGGSGVPGGSSGQLQWNNGGVFAGLTMSGDASIVASTGAITVTKSNGVAFGSAAFEPTSYFQTALGYTPAHAGANSDITSLAGLTTPLSVPQGGTGAGTLSGYVFANGTSAFTASSTISGSAITGPIPGNAGNLTCCATLPNGTLAVTQAVNNNSQDLATTAYVATPGNISPTSISLSGSGPSTLGLPPTTYSALTGAFPCASNEGRMAMVSDSTTQVWGAVYSGGGSLFAGVVCDSTGAYTVFAK